MLRKWQLSHNRSMDGVEGGPGCVRVRGEGQHLNQS